MASIQDYGDQSRWFAGIPEPGVNRLDTGTQKFWYGGSSYPALYTQNLEGVVKMGCSSTMTMAPAVIYSSSPVSVSCSSEVKIVLQIGGSASDVGTMKYWYQGNSFDLIKKAVSTGSPSKVVSSGPPRKPKILGYPSTIKIVDARIGTKSTAAAGSGGSGGTSTIKVGDQSRWFKGLPVDGMIRESNA